MEDGSAPPEAVRIDQVCGGRITRLGFTDSGGWFSTTSNIDQITDASSPAIVSGAASPFGGSILEYTDCSVRAFLPGYRSTEIKMHLAGGGPKTLILHPAAKVEGVTVSATSLTAPKNAQKALEKATKAMRKHKWDDAKPELERAVAAYPNYAAAWSELGNLHLEQGKREQAREAFRRAVSIDPKFTSPYFGLAELALKEQKWVEMAQATATLIKLDAYSMPAAYAYDAMAQLNLSHLEAAEKSAREGLKMDTSGEVPKLHHLLGVVLMRRRDYPAAADELRAYLGTLRDGPEAESVRRQLDACETRQAGRSPAQQPFMR